MGHQETEFFGRPEHLGIHELKNSVSGRNDDQSRIVAVRRRGNWRLDSVSAVGGVGCGHNQCELSLVGATDRDTSRELGLELAALGEYVAVRGAGCVAI